MVGVWLVVLLASSSILYGKGPRLIVKKTQSSFLEGIFCAERCCVIVHRQSVKAYVQMHNGNVQQNPSCAASCHNESSHLSPVLAYDFLSRCKFSTPNIAHLCTAELVHRWALWYLWNPWVMPTQGPYLPCGRGFTGVLLTLWVPC